MPDEIDQANEQAELFLQEARASRKPSSGLVACGHCHYCERTFAEDEPSVDKKLFCDSECSSAYEAEKRTRSLR